VPLKDPAGLYYETESLVAPVAVSAVREIGEVTYYRILAAADVSATALEQIQSTEEVPPALVSALVLDAPKDELREVTDIPAPRLVPDMFRGAIH